MEPFEENYDFDDASNEWMKNKIKLGSGHYKYVCGHLTTKGKKCLRKPKAFKRKCPQHYKLIIKISDGSKPKKYTKS